MKNNEMEEMVWRIRFQIFKQFPNISRIRISFYDNETYNLQIIDLNLHKRYFSYIVSYNSLKYFKLKFSIKIIPLIKYF